MRPPGTDISKELAQMQAAAAKAATLPHTLQRLRALILDHRPELITSVIYPLVLMLSGLNVLSTWTPNLLLALGADATFALRSNALMMAVGLVAALLGEPKRGGGFWLCSLCMRLPVVVYEMPCI